MAQIINLSDFKNGPKLTVEELIIECAEEVSEAWEYHARNNRLNKHFLESVPTWTDYNVNYLQDLNAVSAVEVKIGLTLTLSAPGSNPASLGWVAGFSFYGRKVETPYMVSEQHARCFNVLLFQKLGREQTRAHLTTLKP